MHLCIVSVHVKSCVVCFVTWRKNDFDQLSMLGCALDEWSEMHFTVVMSEFPLHCLKHCTVLIGQNLFPSPFVNLILCDNVIFKVYQICVWPSFWTLSPLFYCHDTQVIVTVSCSRYQIISVYKSHKHYPCLFHYLCTVISHTNTCYGPGCSSIVSV